MIKWTLMSLSVSLAVSGAIITRLHHDDCSNLPQYYLNGSVYTPAGTYGINYVCTEGGGTCTYYTLDNVNYLPCQSGTYCTASCFRREKGQAVKSKSAVIADYSVR